MLDSIPFDFSLTFMQLKYSIPTLLETNPAITNGVECVNSKGGVAFINTGEGKFEVELEYDFDYTFTGDYEICREEFVRLAGE